MSEDSSGAPPKGEEFVHYQGGHEYRGCVICGDIYPAGTYKTHQLEPKHAAMRVQRLQTQNRASQEKWRQKQKSQNARN